MTNGPVIDKITRPGDSEFGVCCNIRLLNVALDYKTLKVWRRDKMV